MKSRKHIPVSFLKNPVHFLALGFGSGLMPKAPGTFGTLAAIPVYLLFSLLSMELYIAAVILLSLVGVWICGYTSRKLGVHDHPGIVIDEFAGYLITMIALPTTGLWIVVGFILFRIFDILKPWPISWLDKHVHGGLGIMLDDILAGFFALCIAHLLIFLF
ncbi:MAG: phosphatidylglycerophosphatase A [Gammaproteobacteria bacterium]|nr:phosphatidylglycerophosphatase A [Gammaproteobacteria bacterium]